MEALVQYFHAGDGFPVRTTWLKAIKVGNYRTSPGITLANATAYCPSADETIEVHIVQSRQGVRSTKPKIPRRPIPDTSPDDSYLPSTTSRELHIHTVHTSKLYTDDTGRFPIKSRSRNQYLMVAYHWDPNTILVAPFKTRKDKQRLEAYKSIMTRLRKNGMSVNLQILDNDASSKFKLLITEDLGIKYKLAPPDIHRRNAAERAIRNFKAHFLSILVGIAPDFPKFLWDHLLPQTEIALNMCHCKWSYSWWFIGEKILTQGNFKYHGERFQESSYFYLKAFTKGFSITWGGYFTRGNPTYKHACNLHICCN